MKMKARKVEYIRVLGAGIVISLGSALLMGGCGSSNSGVPPPGPGPGTTGASCSAASQCYSGIDAGTLKGTVQCLNVTGGYCTHTCQSDADCCAVPGECAAHLHEVCSPFESTGQKYCFLSCEAGDIYPSNLDPTTFCQRYASSAFTCRSTGGGQAGAPRKVCLP